MSLLTKDLSVGFDKTAVVQDIELGMMPGSILAIAGPNGAGKSTLLKTLARLVKPISGRVELVGIDIWTLSARDFAREVSYVPQSQDFERDLTVQELVSLGRNPHQSWWSWQASAEDREAVKDALEKTATWDLRTKYLSNLSGGERQRALIATALAQRPKLLLLDEPIAHLDFRHQLELADLLLMLKEQGLGIAVVLHDLNMIAKLADQVLLIGRPIKEQASRVLMSGTVAEVLQPPILKQVFQVDVRSIADIESNSQVYVTSL